MAFRGLLKCAEGHKSGALTGMLKASIHPGYPGRPEQFNPILTLRPKEGGYVLLLNQTLLMFNRFFKNNRRLAKIS
jgi:hypothetical protein